MLSSPRTSQIVTTQSACQSRAPERLDMGSYYGNQIETPALGRPDADKPSERHNSWGRLERPPHDAHYTRRIYLPPSAWTDVRTVHEIRRIEVCPCRIRRNRRCQTAWPVSKTLSGRSLDTSNPASWRLARPDLPRTRMDTVVIAKMVWTSRWMPSEARCGRGLARGWGGTLVEGGPAQRGCSNVSVETPR